AAARRLSQVEDPNVVDLYDFVETPDGAAIVMQHAEGVSLRRVLAAQGPTGPLAALSMLGGALLGLAAAHDRDVVHGAMRPANIIIDANGNARLTDFATAPAGTEAQAGPSTPPPNCGTARPPPSPPTCTPPPRSSTSASPGGPRTPGGTWRGCTARRRSPPTRSPGRCA